MSWLLPYIYPTKEYNKTIQIQNVELQNVPTSQEIAQRSSLVILEFDTEI